MSQSYLQYWRDWQNAWSTKILWVFEHQKEVEVSNKDSYQLNETSGNNNNKKWLYMHYMSVTKWPSKINFLTLYWII